MDILSIVASNEKPIKDLQEKFTEDFEKPCIDFLIHKNLFSGVSWWVESAAWTEDLEEAVCLYLSEHLQYQGTVQLSPALKMTWNLIKVYMVEMYAAYLLSSIKMDIRYENFIEKKQTCQSATAYLEEKAEVFSPFVNRPLLKQRVLDYISNGSNFEGDLQFITNMLKQ